MKRQTIGGLVLTGIFAAAGATAQTAARPVTSPVASASASASASAADDNDDEDSDDAGAAPSAAAAATSLVPEKKAAPAHEVVVPQEASALPATPAVEEADVPDTALEANTLLSVGVRRSWVNHDGYQLFSTDDGFTSVGVTAGRTVWSSGSLSLAVRAGWDYGSTDAVTRGERASLVVHRLSLGLEGRYSSAPWWFASTRVAPLAIQTRATLSDADLYGDLRSVNWSAGAELAVGGALRLTRSRRGIGFWVLAEAGYALASSANLALTPATDTSAPERTVPRDEGTLGIGGPQVRVDLAVTLP